MRLVQARNIISEEIKYGNLSEEQEEAMRIALDCIIKMEQIREEAEELYEEEIDLADFGERVTNII